MELELEMSYQLFDNQTGCGRKDSFVEQRTPQPAKRTSSFFRLEKEPESAVLVRRRRGRGRMRRTMVVRMMLKETGGVSAALRPLQAHTYDRGHAFHHMGGAEAACNNFDFGDDVTIEFEENERY